MTQTIEERLQTIEEAFSSFATEFQQTKISRRGVEGPKGDPGAPSNVPGPIGPAGKDADITEVVAASKQLVSDALAQFKKELRTIVTEELADRVGPAGRNGVDGKSGRDGADSTVPGPAGAPGKGGAPGRDAKIALGSVTTGNEAKASLHEENGVYVLNLVIPRGDSVVGPAGRDGADSTVPGPQGEPGKEVDEEALISIVEARLRRTWKNDIQIALRANVAA
jgi:hypothetical protein